MLWLELAWLSSTRLSGRPTNSTVSSRPGVTYGLMILVTVACGALAWRHRSLVIAVLGLAGGFATPLLLSTGTDNPIGLFGYILVLDTGLLFLAQRRRWPLLGLLGLLATVFYQAAVDLSRDGSRTDGAGASHSRSIRGSLRAYREPVPSPGPAPASAASGS